jgi:hypothetical protein
MLADGTEPEYSSALADARVSQILRNLYAFAGELFRHVMTVLTLLASHDVRGFAAESIVENNLERRAAAKPAGAGLSTGASRAR